MSDFPPTFSVSPGLTACDGLNWPSARIVHSGEWVAVACNAQRTTRETDNGLDEVIRRKEIKRFVFLAVQKTGSRWTVWSYPRGETVPRFLILFPISSPRNPSSRRRGWRRTRFQTSRVDSSR